MSVCVCVYIYIYIYRERERERERDKFLLLLHTPQKVDPALIATNKLNTCIKIQRLLSDN